MHPTILAKRKAEAVGKLIYAAERLAETLSLDPALVAGLHPVGFKDTHVRELMLLEGVAALITAMAIHAGAITESVSMETLEPEPVAESQFLAAEATDQALREAPPAQEEPAASKPSSRKRKK